MRRSIILLPALGVLAACNQAADQPAANATGNAAAPAKKPGFCFFKPEEMKGWKASADAKGNITVTGKAHVKDSRYVAQFGEPEIEGSTASLALTIAQKRHLRRNRRLVGPQGNDSGEPCASERERYVRRQVGRGSAAEKGLSGAPSTCADSPRGAPWPRGRTR